MSEPYSQKYTVVCFLEPHKKSSNFSALDWPLHVTILDTFKTDWQLNTLCDALREVAAGIDSFDAMPTKQAMLGENKDVTVKLLQREWPMLSLHMLLMELVSAGGLVFNTPEFVGDGFLPHITDQVGSQVEIGKPYRLKNISLVDMFPGSDYMRREVVDTFSFK